jgi:hypothetical protein
MKIMDLRELYADPSVPVTIRPFIHRELLVRGEEPTLDVKEQVFEIGEEEMAEIEAEGTMLEIIDEEEQQRSDTE